MTQVRFTKFGANSAFGNFAPGETLRCGEAMAKHLVEEVKVAEYVAVPAPITEVEPAVEPTAETKPARAKKGAK